MKILSHYFLPINKVEDLYADDLTINYYTIRQHLVSIDTVRLVRLTNFHHPFLQVLLE